MKAVHDPGQIIRYTTDDRHSEVLHITTSGGTIVQQAPIKLKMFRLFISMQKLSIIILRGVSICDTLFSLGL